MTIRSAFFMDLQHRFNYKVFQNVKTYSDFCAVSFYFWIAVLKYP